MLTFRIRPSTEAIIKGASLSPQELYDSGMFEFDKAAINDLSAEELEFAKGLDGEELDYFLALNPESRARIAKSNPDSPVGEEEEVAVEVAAPDGAVTQVAAVKPAGEAVTVATPEVSVTSAPAGTQTSVVKSAAGGDMDPFEKVASAQPIYKARDGSLYYKETEAKLAAKIDEMEDEKEKEKVAAKTEKAFNLYPDVPRSIVKHLVATGASEAVFKDLLSMNGKAAFMSKQFGAPVDEDSAANPFESLVAKAMDNGKVPYSKALTEVMQTDAGREAYAAANPGQPH